MIEIICNRDGANKGESSDENKGIRHPKNIKQIGDVSSEKKIYIEDYAFSYINSLSYGAPEEEHAGVLLGECENSDTEKCIFIKGVVKAKPDEGGQSKVIFNEAVWDKIYSDIEKYFPNLSVVGWFVATSSLTAERMRVFKKIHMDNFVGSAKTMYLINTAEKEESFYLYENGDLRKQGGYVCFYERNYEMQEYMLDKRGKRFVEAEQKDNVMRSIRTIIKEKEEVKQEKKNNTIMYGVSAFMVVAAAVIGINLMNNYEKMKRFDSYLNSISKELASINSSDGVLGEISGEISGEVSGEVSKDVVEVNRVQGGVYPTEAETMCNQVVDATVGQSSGEVSGQTEPETDQTTGNKETVKESATDKPAQTNVTNTKTHTVAKGDTLINISKKYYGNAAKTTDIAKLNDIDDADRLYIGQIIKLP